MNLQGIVKRILLEKLLSETDPKVGTGKKPEGSGRRLYTDENPSDTVSVKFKTKQDIVDTLNKDSFKSKSHARQSQIINLIHQRLRVALERAKDPEVKFSVPPAPLFFFPSHSTITDASPAVNAGAEGSSGFIADCPDL